MTLAAPNDPTLLILISLAGGPKHGYAIMTDVEAFAGVRLGPGTLYGAIPRLERDGLVAPIPTDDRRQPYELTARGETALAAALTDLAQLARTAEGRLAA
jgi:DNA-binding PadR family transcriptional regulator